MFVTTFLYLLQPNGVEAFSHLTNLWVDVGGGEGGDARLKISNSVSTLTLVLARVELNPVLVQGRDFSTQDKISSVCVKQVWNDMEALV